MARDIFVSALAECNVARAFARAVRIQTSPDGKRTLRIGGTGIDLARVHRIRILAVGKAAPSMLEAMLGAMRDAVQAALPLNPSAHLDLQGILIAPTQPRELPIGFQFFAGGHPLPNEASFAAARATIAMLDAISLEPTLASTTVSGTLCLFLISGGASAMLELPLNPAISLEDTIAFHHALVHSGATISEINCVRKHFSAVKGGRLAAHAKGAICVTIAISDVPQGHADAIGSGPAVPDTTTLAECNAILLRYHLLERFPALVRQFFLADLPETPKPGWKSGASPPQSLCLLDAGDLAQAALHRAEQMGFHAIIDNTCDDWDYRAAAEYLLERLRTLRHNEKRVCLISVGEVTVELADQRLLPAVSTRIGGRNQQFALHAATRLEASDAPIAVLSAGSDGIDGNSTAAGAVIDQRTLQDPQLRSAAQQALQQFCATAFLESVGGLLTTGPTGNNLRDLRLLLAEVPDVL